MFAAEIVHCGIVDANILSIPGVDGFVEKISYVPFGMYGTDLLASSISHDEADTSL